MINLRLGRRNYFDKAIWYANAVYQANESVLNIVYSSNSLGYQDTELPHLPENYRLATQEDINVIPETTHENQVIKITYALNTNSSESNNLYTPIETGMTKQSKLTGRKLPMYLLDFYHDNNLADFANLEKYPAPQGTLNVKPLGTFNNGANQFLDQVMFQTNNVQLETLDFIGALKKNDFIYFRKEWWRVDNIQVYEYNKSQQYQIHKDTKTIISLVK